MRNQALYDRCRAAITIDPHDIGEDLIRHPQLVLDINDGVTESAEAAARASNALTVARATATAILRAEGIDGKAVSDTRIATELPLNDEVAAAKEAEIVAEAEKRRWDGLSAAAMAKGSSLKRMAELTVAGFLAPRGGGTPRQPAAPGYGDPEADRNRAELAERRRADPPIRRRPLPPADGV